MDGENKELPDERTKDSESFPTTNSDSNSSVELSVPMPDLFGVANSIGDVLQGLHQRTAEHIQSMYIDKARDYLKRSQTSSVLFKTGHQIANEYFESKIKPPSI